MHDGRALPGWRSRSVALSLFVLAMGPARAEPGTSPEDILRLADRTVAQLQMAQYGDLWETAAPMVRATTDKGSFVRQMQATQMTDRAVLDHGWASITRIRYQHSRDIPDGLYANVDYAVHLKNGDVKYRLISFRLEGDGRWYFVGSAERQYSNGVPTQPVIFKFPP
ncbi:DUF4019 domain-containing protein [Ralstonia flatus]|uniref:DUF4019 domain-containing protein n=1 Tax=Ralstonia flatus TaxID=3058601 RepID=A0AAD2F6C5_9RALS|nr:DUF4019 domain-containing protein [Ralstonia sp. LMG 32965]MBN6207255.1 DUF4019 domain-containing protein [Ralstonia pickettii]CAJ0883771.1 hypothetical protein R77567_03606 [Ralstonia sp. LMG 32965]CAJ0901770.1 hypothetical protein R77564_04621 [Ralstonia sp. LMG 32965]